MWRERFRGELTSDQGVVYHLKHGLSKQVVSPSGLVKVPPHASSSNIWNFPPLMPTHRTTLRFTPRPHVVLHCRGNILLFAASLDVKVEKTTYKRVLPSPSPGSASWERSPFPRTGGRPEVCSQQNTGCRERRGPLESYSTRDASSFPGHMTPSTARARDKGQNHLKSLISAWEDRSCSRQGLSLDNPGENSPFTFRSPLKISHY